MGLSARGLNEDLALIDRALLFDDHPRRIRPAFLVAKPLLLGHEHEARIFSGRRVGELSNSGGVFDALIERERSLFMAVSPSQL